MTDDQLGDPVHDDTDADQTADAATDAETGAHRADDGSATDADGRAGSGGTTDTAAAPRAVAVLNGANLGRLGAREPEIYGATTYAELAALCVAAGRELGLAVSVRQTESEADLLRWLHDAAEHATPVVLNAGAWTHTSLAVGDACAMLTAPLIEVHLSNVHQRETFRHHSYVSAHASGVIVGLGVQGYVLALSYLASS